MFNARQAGGLPLAVHIAIGVASGCIIAAACIFYLWQWQLRQAAEEASAQLKASMAASKAEADREAERARKAEAAKRVELAAAERAVDERKRRLLDQIQQREEAWRGSTASRLTATRVVAVVGPWIARTISFAPRRPLPNTTDQRVRIQAIDASRVGGFAPARRSGT